MRQAAWMGLALVVLGTACTAIAGLNGETIDPCFDGCVDGASGVDGTSGVDGASAGLDAAAMSDTNPTSGGDSRAPSTDSPGEASSRVPDAGVDSTPDCTTATTTCGESVGICTATDSNNCGACGHSCGGGGCVAGACQPIILATGQATPTGVAVDSTNVYWANAGTPGGIMAVPKTGGTVVTLASGSDNPLWIVINDGGVAWMDTENDVERVGFDGTGRATLEPAVTGIYDLTVDDTFVYYNSNRTIYSASVTAAGSPTKLGNASDAIYCLTSDDTNVYALTALGNVYAEPKTGGNPTLLGMGEPNGESMTNDATTLYWITSDGNAEYLPKTGGTPTLVAGGLGAVVDLTTDSEAIYTSAPTAIIRVPLDGSAPSPMVSELLSPQGVASDSQYVYFATADGKIMAVAK